jgi:hypothetical protein
MAAAMGRAAGMGFGGSPGEDDMRRVGTIVGRMVAMAALVSGLVGAEVWAQGPNGVVEAWCATSRVESCPA